MYGFRRIIYPLQPRKRSVPLFMWLHYTPLMLFALISLRITHTRAYKAKDIAVLPGLRWSWTAESKNKISTWTHNLKSKISTWKPSHSICFICKLKKKKKTRGYLSLIVRHFCSFSFIAENLKSKISVRKYCAKRVLDGWYENMIQKPFKSGAQQYWKHYIYHEDKKKKVPNPLTHECSRKPEYSLSFG